MTVDFKKIHSQLIDLGYYVGTFDDFYSDPLNTDPAELRKHADTIIASQKYMDTVYVYRHNYIGQNDSAVLNSGQVIPPEESTQEVSYHHVDRRKQFVEHLIANGNKTRTTQQWYRMGLELYNAIDPKLASDYYKVDAFFDNLFASFGEKVYPEYYGKKEQLKCASQYSIYKEGDFSELHFDGINPGRAFVIIVYFADPADHKPESGGELRISDKHVETKVKPVYGNYAVLDFTRWNIGHAIERVNDNFTRFALQSFVGLY